MSLRALATALLMPSFDRTAREAGGLDLFIGRLVVEIIDRQQRPFREAANSASDLVTGTRGSRVSRLLERSEPPVPTSWICPVLAGTQSNRPRVVEVDGASSRAKGTLHTCTCGSVGEDRDRVRPGEFQGWYRHRGDANHP